MFLYGLTISNMLFHDLLGHLSVNSSVHHPGLITKYDLKDRLLLAQTNTAD
jgi:hypothetical protein